VLDEFGEGLAKRGLRARKSGGRCRERFLAERAGEPDPLTRTSRAAGGAASSVALQEQARSAPLRAAADSPSLRPLSDPTQLGPVQFLGARSPLAPVTPYIDRECLGNHRSSSLVGVTSKISIPVMLTANHVMLVTEHQATL